MKHLAILVAALFMVACGTTNNPQPDVVADTTGGDVSADLVNEDAQAPGCGNNECDPGETCWTCPGDCECRCGDGVCTHGEACFNCPADCDCTTLGATPPMGWNSWNKFHCDISETLALEIADAMVSSGMKDAGYQYINLDDCWQIDRSEDDIIVPDPVRFAGGMKALGDAIHEKGLKYGVYSCAGTMTCEERPGSFGFETTDMAAYADWGVDYAKVDWCFAEELDAKTQYAKFRDGIAATGRPMILSICNWGLQDPWVWGADMGQLWRTSGDIKDDIFSMIINLEKAATTAAYAGPGHWNDPDMLEVGNGGMTTDDYRAHMSLWAITASPLIAGNDLRSMDEVTKEILTNAEVIAVDQDPLGLQGVRIIDGGGLTPDLWAKPLAHAGWRAIVVYNRGSEAVEIDITASDIGLAAGDVKVRDLWSHQDVGTLADSFPLTIPAYTSRMFRLEGTEPTASAGETYVSDMPWIYMANSRGPAERDSSNGLSKAGDGEPISIRETRFTKGIGAYAGSIVMIPLGGKCSSFQADVGVDDAADGEGSTSFEVWADNTKLFDSGVMTGADQAKAVQVALDGMMYLKLVTTAASDTESKDFADWAGARITCQ